MPTCQECENDLDIELDEVEEGDVVACEECGTEYEVVGVDPLELTKVGDELDEDDEIRGGRRGRRRMRLRTRWAAGMSWPRWRWFVGPVLRIAGPAAVAQNLGQRVVEGMVADADSADVARPPYFYAIRRPRPSAAIPPTKSGRFRFVQVNMSDDCDLWAEKKGEKSATKTVSSWDTRKDVEEILKLK